MSLLMWIGWALLCIAQNFSFTFVSRARNSGSLKKHMIAGFFSNGVWFVGQLFAVSAFMSILSGHFGIPLAIAAGVYYTVFTLTGSLLAHKYALMTEKGTARVGAHKDVATFTSEEGEKIRGLLASFQGVPGLATTHASPTFTEEEAKMIRTRTLVCDTGDGIGTFTTAEIGALKELVGTKLETVDELVTVSLPGASPVTTPDDTGNLSDAAVSEVIKEGYVINPSGVPVDVKVDERGYATEGK